MTRTQRTTRVVNVTAYYNATNEDDVILANGTFTVGMTTDIEGFIYRPGQKIVVKNVGAGVITVWWSNTTTTLDPLESAAFLYTSESDDVNGWRLVYQTPGATMSREAPPAPPADPLVAVYGYTIGGYAHNDSYRMTFSTETFAAHTLADGYSAMTAGISDIRHYGYACGGSGHGSGSELTTLRTTYTTGTTAYCGTAYLSSPRECVFGISDGTVYGYVMGGTAARGGYSPYVTKVERLTFSTSTMASSAQVLSLKRGTGGSISDGTTYGYALGGEDNWAPVPLGTTDLITFSTSTVAARTVANASGGTAINYSLSDNNIYGYYVPMHQYSPAQNAGNTPAQRITFSTGTTAAHTVSRVNSTRDISWTGAYGCALSNGRTYGYVLGDPLTTVSGEAERMDFSTGTFTVILCSAPRSISCPAFSDGSV